MSDFLNATTMANELKLEQVITNVMINHIGEEGRHIGEGGCPRIQWYALRNELIKAITAWNTRPAAPVEGLVTERWDYLDGSTWKMCKDLPGQYLDKGFQVRELVTRSQAETIIAAERAKVQHWQEQYTEMHSQFIDLAKSAEADNAAMTAQVKELEHDLKSYQEPVINAENEKIDLQFKVIDLETQLAAANNEIKRLKNALGKIYNQPSNRAHFIAIQALNNK